MAVANRQLIADFTALDALVAELLAGCYGSFDYMEVEYGITRAHCARLSEYVAEQAEHHGVHKREVWAALREAADDLEDRMSTLQD